MKPILEASKGENSSSCIFNQTMYMNSTPSRLATTLKASALADQKLKSGKISSMAMSTNETMTQISARVSQNMTKTGRCTGRPMTDLSNSFLNITGDEGTKSMRTTANTTPKGSIHGSYMQGTKASKSKQVVR